RTYQDALRLAPDDFVTLSFAADFARRAERDDEARTLYERLLDPEFLAPPECTAPARRQVALLLAKTDPERALSILEEHRDDSIADQRVGLFIQGRGSASRPEAIRKFEESLQHAPATPDERLPLARMLESADKLNQARTRLAELVDENPRTPLYLARHAHLLI